MLIFFDLKYVIIDTTYFLTQKMISEESSR